MRAMVAILTIGSEISSDNFCTHEAWKLSLTWNPAAATTEAARRGALYSMERLNSSLVEILYKLFNNNSKTYQ